MPSLRGERAAKLSLDWDVVKEEVAQLAKQNLGTGLDPEEFDEAAAANALWIELLQAAAS